MTAVKGRRGNRKTVRHAHPLFVLFVISLLLFLPGCLGELMELSCLFIPDSAHCYQGAATQQGDAEKCEKIEAPAEFKSSGSNPPRDKCYLMIAQNTGDYSACSRIQGGAYSYTKEECVAGVAVSKVDPKGCDNLAGDARTRCKTQVGDKITPDMLGDLDSKIEDLKSSGKSSPELTDLTKQRNDLLAAANSQTQSTYTKTRVADIMDDVEDEDVASSIRKEYIDYKKTHQNENVDQLMTKLESIKKEQELVKRLDDQANELVDTLKGHVTGYADEKKQEIVDAAAEQGWKWVRDQGGDRLKWQLDQLEAAKEKYSKASERYGELQEKIEKYKKVYDEIKGVYDKVDKLNKQIATGEITEGQAKVLKGGVFLGKGLEYATGYVPVFGSTISKVSKETFDATIKLANERAKRTNALDKCFTDPANCDPDKITAY